jgi:crossover junction endodeoxyribonuclease RuvC
MRIVGIDPGLQKTGWGVIEAVDNRLTFIACGLIKTTASWVLPARLQPIAEDRPVEAAIEETFMNNNPASALKLGQARGVAMLAPVRYGITCAEYTANMVKKSVVGAGHADKTQVGMMIKTLLYGCGAPGEDEADALAVAICHAHYAQSAARQYAGIR